jgi:hypothetical protein
MVLEKRSQKDRRKSDGLSKAERSLLARFAVLPPDCKECINLLIDAALSYDMSDPTVLDMFATASKRK